MRTESKFTLSNGTGLKLVNVDDWGFLLVSDRNMHLTFEIPTLEDGVNLVRLLQNHLNDVQPGLYFPLPPEEEAIEADAIRIHHNASELWSKQ